MIHKLPDYSYFDYILVSFLVDLSASIYNPENRKIAKVTLTFFYIFFCHAAFTPIDTGKNICN